MKSIVCLLLFLFQFSISIVHGQVQPRSILDSAYVYYQKHDFKKAAYFFNQYYIDLKQGQSNNDTFSAAIASCHAGDKEKATYYLRRSGEIGYDYSKYEEFVNGSLSTCLKDLPGWTKYASTFKFKTDSILSKLKRITDGITDQSKRVNHSALTDSAYLQKFYRENSPEKLIGKIREFNDFPALAASGGWTLYQMKVNDTLTVPYLLYIPENYDHRQKNPLYVYLHGAASRGSSFLNPGFVPEGEQIKIMDKAKEQHAFILYPFANTHFNWLYHQLAFETILKEITRVKSLYNINDNKVYIGGHSDGGGGAFWFAVQQPSAFASYYCLNFLPMIRQGNTPLANLHNQFKVFGVSATEDSIFPLVLVSRIYDTAVKNGANWQNHTIKGEHTLSITHRDSINFVFDSLQTISRNPFPEKIEWETDNVKNGRYLWIGITQLDIAAERASWHKTVNPTFIINGKEGKYDFNIIKSGAVKAVAKDNIIRIESSRVKEIILYVSPDQFDLKKKIRIYVNGVLLFDKKVKANKAVVFDEFLKTADRSFIIVNKIRLTLK
jgi:pimeloyl-ACP methyl ester carboxylesterase